MTQPRVIAIPCPFGRASISYAYFLDAQEPVLIDSGIATSPAQAIEPALRAVGRSLGDVRRIVLTHGHWDHAWGARRIREHFASSAEVVMHAEDEILVRQWQVHLETYLGVRFRHLDREDERDHTQALLLESFAGEIAVDRALVEGDRIDLGPGLWLEVVTTPGHSPGSVTYYLNQTGWAFVGDAVQVCGSSGSSRFPLLVDPVAYRQSLTRLAQEVKPSRLYLGHRFLDASLQPLSHQLDGPEAFAALQTSIDMEARLSEAAARIDEDALPGAVALTPAAAVLGLSMYDPEHWPAPFFTTLDGYLWSGHPSNWTNNR